MDQTLPRFETERRRRRECGPLPMPNVADRLPPYSIEAEQGVLGCVLLSPNDCMGICIEKLKRGSEVFYDMRHQALFDVLAEMYDKKELIDPITVQQYLKDRNQLEALGGMPYIAGLMNCVPSAASLEYYIEIVLEKHALRRIIQTCTGAVARVYDHHGEVDGLIDGLFGDIIALSKERDRGAEEKSIKELVHETLNKMEYYQAHQGEVRGLPTGFPDLDAMTSGFMGGQYVVIAARPSMGKTSLAMNIAEYVAVDTRKPVGIFSMEMSAEELTFRLTCSRARVDSKNVLDGFLTERDFPKLTAAASKLANAPIFIDERGGLNIRQLASKARQWHQQHEIRMIVVDYLQLMQPPAGFKGNRSEALTIISNGIKALAKELGLPIIVLAQINRESEKQERPPRPSDLKDCGAIEQDADILLMLHNPEAGVEIHGEVEAIPVHALMLKNRNGPTRKVDLTFLKSYTRFESASKVADVPI